MKRGEEFDLEIEKFADRGKSLARVNGYVIFVDGAVPGDVVRVRVGKAKKNFAEAKLIDLLEPSPMRVEPRCRYFGTCGGCKWQHVSYDQQLKAKTESVQGALVHQGQLGELVVNPAIGSENVYHYRNKMEYSFSAQRWLTDWEIASGEEFDTDFALGLHIPGRFDKVLDVHECHLPPPVAVEVLNAVRDFVRERGWKPWNVHTHSGFLRHLVLRTAEFTDDLMVNLITNGKNSEKMSEMGGFLQESFPQITTFVNTIHTGLAQTAFGEYSVTVFGPGVIHDKIGDLRFELAPNAFFQTNTSQAVKLYDVVRDFSDFKATDLVYDLYCGAGTISLWAALHVSRVVGVELVEEAVQNARRNADINGITNCKFYGGDLMRMFTEHFISENGHPDVLIVDPPRAGMHEKVTRQIASLRPERLVYVSCNPMTQARDLALLRDEYEVEAVQPVDLFPHTYHIENVVKLRARSA